VFALRQENGAYSTLIEDSRRETAPVGGRAFGRYVRRAFYDAYGDVLHGETLAVVRAFCEMRAEEGGVRDARVRVARDTDGDVLVDTGSPSWNAYRISPQGWKLEAAHPLPFMRGQTMAAFPTPVTGRPLVEILETEFGYDRPSALLAAAWVVACYSPGPYLVLILIGEQGTGKTTLATILRRLTDPSTVPTAGPPKESRDIVVAAVNRYVIAFDNLSSIPGWLSDELARIATGSGVSQRSLYTNLDEIALTYRRPVMLTGISSPASAADLLDRALVCALPTITEAARMKEEEIQQRVDALAGEMFGSVLRAVSAALANAASTPDARWARMTDAITFSLAAAEALGSTRVELEQVLRENVATRDRIVLEENALTEAVVEFMEGRDSWSGSSSELLEALITNGVNEKLLPRAANKVSHEMNRAAPVLRRLGINYSVDTNTKKRTKHLRRAPADDGPTSAERIATAATTGPDTNTDGALEHRTSRLGSDRSGRSDDAGHHRPETSDTTDQDEIERLADLYRSQIDSAT
jgi:hypothetical protein